MILVSEINGTACREITSTLLYPLNMAWFHWYLLYSVLNDTAHVFYMQEIFCGQLSTRIVRLSYRKKKTPAF